MKMNRESINVLSESLKSLKDIGFNIIKDTKYFYGDTLLIHQMGHEPYRKKIDDYVYFNSDLNKFIGENLPNKFTAQDIDLLLIKKSRKKILICEYKHEDEPMSGEKGQQSSSLELLSKMKHPEYELDVCIIRGNYPFDKLEVTYLTRKNKKYIYEGFDVWRFLSMSEDDDEINELKNMYNNFKNEISK